MKKKPDPRQQLVDAIKGMVIAGRPVVVKDEQRLKDSIIDVREMPTVKMTGGTITVQHGSKKLVINKEPK